MNVVTRNVLFVVGALVVISVVILASGPDILDMGPTRDGRTPEVVDMGTISDMQSKLPDLGFNMPPFQGITRWWNTPGNRPLTPEGLKGKVVMVEFWTYSCINCIRTYPFIKRWYELYEDDGFVLIGVHTPEFTFEAKPENVEREINENGFTFPVALDTNYKTWRAYNNRFWPASYLFDKEGHLRYTHFGEGKYDVTENAIRDLLMEGGGTISEQDMPMPEESTDFLMIKTRETYFGYERGENFANALDVVIDANTDYDLQMVGLNEWSVGGPWRIEDERAVALAQGAKHAMSVQAPIYNIVMDAPEGTEARIRITVDGKQLTPEMRTEDVIVDEEGSDTITISTSDLYRILNMPDGERHIVEIEVLEGEVRFYAATFG